MRETEKPNNQIDAEDAKADPLQTNLKRRGRPKCFNEQQALEKAMLLFWQYGYEATSISDLILALGITAPSLYSSFGDKAQLFAKCLDYYLEHESCAMDDIFQQSANIKIALELYLLESAQKLIQKNKPTGCMFVVATMNCSKENHGIQQQLLDQRQLSKQKLFHYLVIAQTQGQIPEHIHVESLTDFYTTLLHGMTLQARDGASLSQLQQVVKMSMYAWNEWMTESEA